MTMDPSFIAVSPNDETAYVTSITDSTSSAQVVASIPVGNGAANVLDLSQLPTSALVADEIAIEEAGCLGGDDVEGEDGDGDEDGDDEDDEDDEEEGTDEDDEGLDMVAILRKAGVETRGPGTPTVAVAVPKKTGNTPHQRNTGPPPAGKTNTQRTSTSLNSSRPNNVPAPRTSISTTSPTGRR
ncbi:hypothetical protein PsYK624_055470 [Phanerochaete sordida]|uniref:Uncharacterized protein n=1 Tax=Phanerochaete sordida TaxID=48140 RepID=A0A9P3G742_9APHY|nr:hypothetical protein PsYK624_055470 [Phanerochaete sordida]